MTRNFKRPLIVASFAVLLAGCIATSAKWMAYVYVSPDAFNQVFTDSEGNAVHAYDNDTSLQIATYDETGAIILETSIDQTIDGNNGRFDLTESRLLVMASTLSGSFVIDGDSHTANPIDASMIPEAIADVLLTGATALSKEKIIAFGDLDGQGWMLVMDFTALTSELVNITDAVSIRKVFGHNDIVTSIDTTEGISIVSYDADLNETGRFVYDFSNFTLIGESLGRPTFYHTSNHNVMVVDTAGELVWEFENDVYENIKGQSVGPDGRVLLWGDDSKFNVLSSVAKDNAHFLLISPEGELHYHYLGGDPMAKVFYKNIKQFPNGQVQATYQGWTGELTGFLIGNTLGTPFTVQRKVFHDFISLKGNKVRFMLEPKRVETYLQGCGGFCVNLTTDTEGHCDNLDVYNIGGNALLSLTQVCEHRNESGGLLPDTVKVTRY